MRRGFRPRAGEWVGTAAMPHERALPQRENPQVSYATDAEPVLVAERARQATRAQRCVLCDRAILPPQRLADLVSDGGVAHLGCIGMDRRQ